MTTSTLTDIVLKGIGKKFRSQWIFRNVDLQIKQGERIAITGYNGSGKSTFLQLISGYVHPTEGVLQWKTTQGEINIESVHRHLSFASPYMELIEEFTLEENVKFYCAHKKFHGHLTPSVIIEKAMLTEGIKKPVKYFSSGMKQRLRLALAILADTPVLLLDEPLSNLDSTGYDWYQLMMQSVNPMRIVLICSNRVKEETSFCTGSLNIEDYKTK